MTVGRSTLNAIRVAPSTGIDPYTNDRTPLVSVDITHTDPKTGHKETKTYDKISQYAYDSDILQLGDPFSVNIPDPNSQYTILEGDLIKLHMSDPDVAGGARVPKVSGVVVQPSVSSAEGQGTVINLSAADIGWFLVKCDAPYWKRLSNRPTFQRLFDVLVDPSWGFSGLRAGNDNNARIKLGGNYARSTITLGDTQKPPIMQTEPGDKPADKFIEYAKLANRLVNVSHDGYLQLYKPRYDTPIAYKFRHYKTGQEGNNKNNVIRATLTRSLESVYTKSVCIGTWVIPETEAIDPNNPNQQNFRGTYVDPSPEISFSRLAAFNDPDRLNRDAAAARAKWMLQRGLFDAWTYEITVRGHSQDGLFFEPDTMCEVKDTVLRIEGNYYVQAVRYTRDEGSGTLTTLTIKKPGLLAA